MQKMKIGVLVQNFNVLPRSISPKQAYEVHKRMQKRADVIVVTNDPFFKTKREFSKQEGFKVYTLNASCFGLLFNKKVAEIFAKENVDVISVYAGILGACTASKSLKRCNKPLVLNIFKGRPELRDFKSLCLSDISRHYKRIFDFHSCFSICTPDFFLRRRLASKHIAKICVPGGRVYDDLKTVIKNLEVVPNGIDTSEFAPSKSIGGSQTILYFGRASPLRGIDTLIDAFELVKAKLPKAKLQLCMLGGIYTDLQRFASHAKHKLGQNVEIIGARTDIHKLVTQATAVALPFRFAGEIPEYPLTVLEAMSAGKAVITTPIASIPDFIQDGNNGLLVSPKSPHGLADAMLKVLNDRGLAEKIGKNARKSVESRDWRIVSEQMLRIYEDIYRTWEDGT